jgi:nitroreductase
MPKPAPSDHPVHEYIQERWSPLAFDTKSVSPADLHVLFEAARWAPSCFNEQPWNFIVGTKDGDPETYEKLLSCLTPGNVAWASTAPVLFLGVARLTFAHNGAENRYAFYDTGQALGAITFQASALGIALHQMGGYDIEKARATFSIPEGYSPVAMVALGYEGDPAIFTEEKLRSRHSNPTRSRKPLASFVLGGAVWGEPSPLLPALENNE